MQVGGGEGRRREDASLILTPFLTQSPRSHSLVFSHSAGPVCARHPFLTRLYKHERAGYNQDCCAINTQTGSSRFQLSPHARAFPQNQTRCPQVADRSTTRPDSPLKSLALSLGRPFTYLRIQAFREAIVKLDALATAVKPGIADGLTLRELAAGWSSVCAAQRAHSKHETSVIFPACEKIFPGQVKARGLNAKLCQTSKYSGQRRNERHSLFDGLEWRGSNIEGHHGLGAGCGSGGACQCRPQALSEHSLGFLS